MSVIAVIGSTGPTGQKVISECLRRGCKVKAILRDPSKLKTPDPNIEVNNKYSLNIGVRY